MALRMNCYCAVGGIAKLSIWAILSDQEVKGTGLGPWTPKLASVARALNRIFDKHISVRDWLDNYSSSVLVVSHDRCRHLNLPPG